VRVLSLQKRALAFWLKGYAGWLSPAEAKLVMGMVEAGTALCVPGNHDMKLLQKLRGKDVKIAHGLADSIAQLEIEPPEFKSKVGAILCARAKRSRSSGRILRAMCFTSRAGFMTVMWMP
jgi:hypothetical protein